MQKLKVSGMTCEHCEKAVERALAQLPGVTRVVKVSCADEEAIVDGKADMQALIEAIEQEGYTAAAA